MRRYGRAGGIFFFCFAACTSVAALLPSASNPFQELIAVWTKSDFIYEQVMVPPALRSFFIPLALAPQAGPGWVDWCKRIQKLLHGLEVPPSLHYVAPHYAPELYSEIARMSGRMGIDVPLVFVNRKNASTVATVEAIPLQGNFHALLFNQSFITRHSYQELRAFTARELAKICRRHSDKKKLARKIWWGCVLTYLTVMVSKKGWDILKNNVGWRDTVMDILKNNVVYMIANTGLLVGCGLAAELIDAKLSRTYQHEADLFALRAFEDSSSAYLEALQSVEHDEALYQQRLQFRYRDHYHYVQAQIEALSPAVHSYASCFLKNQLALFQRQQVEKPAFMKKAGFFDKQSSLEERIAYLHQHVKGFEKRTRSRRKSLRD